MGFCCAGLVGFGFGGGRRRRKTIVRATGGDGGNGGDGGDGGGLEDTELFGGGHWERLAVGTAFRNLLTSIFSELLGLFRCFVFFRRDADGDDFG